MTVATVAHQRPRRSPCGHKIYGLSCEDYDRLVAHAGGGCQICGTRPNQTGHGFLVVDHDDTIGQWAVRGLLCQDCNSSLPMGSAPTWAADYLAQPWWKVEFARLDVSPDPTPEPPVGSIVAAHGLNFRRETDGWKHIASFGGTPRNWAELNRRYAPHRIKVLAVPQVDDVSGWPRSERIAYVLAALRAGIKPTEVTRVSDGRMPPFGRWRERQASSPTSATGSGPNA